MEMTSSAVLRVDMAKPYLINDFKVIIRGLEKIATTTAKLKQGEYHKRWNNSSIKNLIDDSSKEFSYKLRTLKRDDVIKSVTETFERTSMVYYGIREYASQSGVSEPSLLEAQELPKGITPADLEISELGQADKELIQRLEREHEAKLQLDKRPIKQHEVKISAPKTAEPPTTNSVIPPTTKKYIVKQKLNPDAKQRKVPSTRIARMVSFGSLAAGLGVGTVAEAARRTFGLTGRDENMTFDRMFLSEANAERIVSTLCKVRGAALKIGQILSIQDNTIISPGLQKAFERVRQSADFMPTWQVNKVLSSELGSNWRQKLAEFEEMPFAAASIGQVHLVKLLDGREAAMKIQYPGVAQGIDSDINNLVGILKIWNVFPKGMFIDNLVEVAKRELSWEVDYEREKECTLKFKSLLDPYPDYVVPQVVDELSTKYVFTTTLIDGLPVDQCVNLDEKSRLHLARLVMDLCLHELFDFRYMQTDPNWSNFFYNPDTRKLALLDFGASRSYSKEFMDQYIEVIKGAADRDRAKVLTLSRDMGFLTGYESKSMEDAHVDAVMILGEVFASDKPFDFGGQNTTLRIQRLVPTIVHERLCPPPEEIYSLHRKLSGVFLLCAKLKVKMSCRDLFLNVYSKYQKG